MTERLWITDRLPTRDDADVNSRVEIARSMGGDSSVQVNWKTVGIGARWRTTKHWQPQIELPIAATITCERCRYFQKWSKPGGECRRNAPQAVMISADNDDCEQIAYWPGVDCADWCGEWEARP
jgi:hypothetical protein